MSNRSRQHEAIQAVMDELEHPATPQEILEISAKRVPGLGLATVYRALGRMIEQGEARKIELSGISPHYESARHEHHHFFVCNDCHKLFDLDGCPGGFMKMVPPGFKMTSHEVVIYGACKQCAV